MVGPTSVTLGVSGRGGLRCWVRLSFQLDILRLMTRGLERMRLGARRRSRISRRAAVNARASREGENAAWSVTWRRTTRKVRVKEIRSGS